jgi:hypothetical protein
MWLEAILTREDLRHVLKQFAPMDLRLGESGKLLLDAPSDVSLIRDKGLAVVCEATLHWPLLGVDIPVHIHALVLLVRPSVERRASGDVLVFTLEIDGANVPLLPKVIDDKITAMVNEELVKKHVELAWNFGKTLSHVFSLPAALESTSTLGLKVSGGKVKVTDDAMGFAVRFRTEVERRREGHPSAPPSSDGGSGAAREPAAAERERPTHSATTPASSKLLRKGGALAAIAVAGAFVLGRLSGRRRGR